MNHVDKDENQLKFSTMLNKCSRKLNNRKGLNTNKLQLKQRQTNLLAVVPEVLDLTHLLKVSLVMNNPVVTSCVPFLRPCVLTLAGLNSSRWSTELYLLHK